MAAKTGQTRPPKVSRPKEAAAGVTAVLNSARHAVEKAGLVRGTRLLLRSNQQAGFDCPGCAWPDPLGHRKVFEFCENGAKAVADEATKRRVNAGFFAQWSVRALAGQSGRWLNDQGRLAEPMLLPAGEEHYRPISWADAFKLVATALNALESPDRAAFYTSGRTSNEAAFLYQLFVRRFGTNNLPDCSNMCHESSGRALTDVLGSGKGSVTLEDFDKADAIFVVGQNPGSNHPRMLATLQAAKRRGAKIVAVNPLAETGLKRFKNPQEISGVFGSGTALADQLLRVKVNGDVALFQGLGKHLIELESSRGGVLDHAFIEQHSSGFEAYRRRIETVSWEDIVTASGVARADIEAAAVVAAESDSTICCWAMGLTQHKNAVANIQEIVNFLLLGGNVGKPGAGVCPVRGHSNVQGDRTMGIWEKPSVALLDALRSEFDFEPPAEHGYDTVDTIHAMHQSKIEVFFAMGGNFARATPDIEYTSEAINRCGLTVQVSTKLNKSHCITGRSALILPALGRTERDLQTGGEQFVTVEDSMGAVRQSRGTLTPASDQLKSEPRIIAELAHAVFGDHDNVDWLGLSDDYDRIRDRIARVIPGFDDFSQRLAEQGEFLLPHAVRDSRIFVTATGKAMFSEHDIEPVEVPDGCFLMTTVRSHDQFNTTVYSENDRYRGISRSRRVLFMGPDSLEQAGLSGGDVINITSHYDGEQRSLRNFRVVPYDVPPGCVAAYYPETNALVPIGAVAEGSNTPAYKSVVVSVAKANLSDPND